AGVRERRRTYEGCRDLHQTRSVLAAVSGGGWALRDHEPPSFGPMQEDPRICFERPEDGQEPRGIRASGAHLYCTAQHHCALQHGEPQRCSQEPSRKMDHPGTFHGSLDRMIEDPRRDPLQAPGARTNCIKGGNRSSIARCLCRTSPASNLRNDMARVKPGLDARRTGPLTPSYAFAMLANDRPI